VLQRRVDALQAAFRVELDELHWKDLLAMKAMAAGLPGGMLDVQVGGVPFALHKRGGSSGAVRLTNADATILVERQVTRTRDGVELPGWSVEVTLRAMYLATHTTREAVELARVLASGVARNPILAERVRRADLAVDLDASFSMADREAFMGRTRRRGAFTPGEAADEKTRKALAALPAGIEPWDGEARSYWSNRKGSPLTGFVFSPGGDFQCRIYDKVAELGRYDLEHEKHAIERGAWGASGWDGVSPVWRVEFQLRGEALDEFRNAAGVAVRDSLEVLVEQLDALWQYATRKWLRLVDLSTVEASGRRDRAKVDPRWMALQSVTFAGVSVPAERKRYKRGGPSRDQLLGTLNAYVYGVGIGVAAKGLPPSEALEANLAKLGAHLRNALDVRYLLSCDAQRARFASVDDVRERFPLECAAE
jgi:hypothetical protein